MHKFVNATSYGACILHVAVGDIASSPPPIPATGVCQTWYVVTHTNYVNKPQEAAVSISDHIRVTTDTHLPV